MGSRKTFSSYMERNDVIRKLKQRVKSKKANVAVIGLGYVGLPVALLIAEKGFRVFGIDRDKEKIRKITRGTSPIQGKEPGLRELLKKISSSKRFHVTSDYSVCRDADIVLLAVETPVDPKSHLPNYQPLSSALASLARNLMSDTLVIIESTLAPGTMENLVSPLLERESRLRQGRDFYLGHCPERVKPGKLLKNLRSYHRVIGAFGKGAADLMSAFYGTYVEGDLDITDPSTAEIVKTCENYYRDVEIAFANQLALLCELYGVNAHEARLLINKTEARNVHYPGAGVGGSCLPKDGYLAVAYARKKNDPGTKLAVEMVELARRINDFMPMHLYHLLQEALRERKVSLKNARIAVLGYAYSANSDDARHAPTITFLKKLQHYTRAISIHDPYFPVYRTPLSRMIKGSDALVLMTAHDAYTHLNLGNIRKLMRTPIIIDGRNVVQKEEARRHGFLYKGVGNK